MVRKHFTFILSIQKVLLYTHENIKGPYYKTYDATSKLKVISFKKVKLIQ